MVEPLSFVSSSDMLYSYIRSLQWPTLWSRFLLLPALHHHPAEQYRRIVWHSDIYYPLYKYPPFDFILSQIYPVHVLQFYFFKFNSKMIALYIEVFQVFSLVPVSSQTPCKNCSFSPCVSHAQPI